MEGSHWEPARLPGFYRPLEGAGWPLIRDQESRLQLEANGNPDYPPGHTPSWPQPWARTLGKPKAGSTQKYSVQAWGVHLWWSIINLQELHSHQFWSARDQSLKNQIKNNKSMVRMRFDEWLLGELAFIAVRTEGVGAKTDAFEGFGGSRYIPDKSTFLWSNEYQQLLQRLLHLYNVESYLIWNNRTFH